MLISECFITSIVHRINSSYYYELLIASLNELAVHSLYCNVKSLKGEQICSFKSVNVLR